MRAEGTWGGNLEIQCIAMHFRLNVVIYVNAAPRWEVINFPPETRCVHLSYHEGNHYNSVRGIAEGDEGIPAPVLQLHEPGHSERAAQQEETPDQRQVREATSETDPCVVERALQWHEGDTDAAIDFLIQGGRVSILEELETEAAERASSALSTTTEGNAASSTKDKGKGKDKTATKDRQKTNKALKHEAAMSKKELKMQKKLEKAKRRGSNPSPDADTDAHAGDAAARALGALRI